MRTLKESIYGNLGIGEDAIAKEWVKTYNAQKCLDSFRSGYGPTEPGGFFASYEDGVIKLPYYIYLEDPDLLDNGALPSYFDFEYAKKDRTGQKIVPLCSKLKSFDNFPKANTCINISIYSCGTSIEKWNVPAPYIKEFTIRGPLNKPVKGIPYIDKLDVDLIMNDSTLSAIKGATICNVAINGMAFESKKYKDLEAFFKNNTFKCKNLYSTDMTLFLNDLCVHNYDFLKDSLDSDATVIIWRHQLRDLGYLSDVMLQQVYGGLQQKHLKRLRFAQPASYISNAIDHGDMVSELGRCIEKGIFKSSQIEFI